MRLAGYTEGSSFLVLLLIAMPLKYLAAMPVAVRIVGSIHGALFIVYVAMMLSVARNYRWPARFMWLGLVAALLPLGPFWFDGKVRQIQ